MPDKSKWCPLCGEELPAEAVRCSHCGRWLDTRVAGSGEASPGPKQPFRPRRRRGRVGLWLALLLLAVVVAVTAALLRLQGAGETTAAFPTLTVTPTAVLTATPSANPTPSATAYPADLAQRTVQQYWDLISKGSISAAYDLLSTTAQESSSRGQFVQSITHLLDVTNGVTAIAGTALVQGNTATVPVMLHFTSSGDSHATQRLIWDAGVWRIDQPGPGATTTR